VFEPVVDEVDPPELVEGEAPVEAGEPPLVEDWRGISGPVGVEQAATRHAQEVSILRCLILPLISPTIVVDAQWDRQSNRGCS
jgi:hypothetical protein